MDFLFMNLHFAVVWLAPLWFTSSPPRVPRGEGREQMRRSTLCVNRYCRISVFNKLWQVWIILHRICMPTQWSWLQISWSLDSSTHRRELQGPLSNFRSIKSERCFPKPWRKEWKPTALPEGTAVGESLIACSWRTWLIFSSGSLLEQSLWSILG